MKKTLGRLIIELLIASILSVIIGTIVDKCTNITIPDDMQNFQFNIITITTVFAGFSFSVLGVLISLSSTSVMERLKETSELKTSCNVITDSIVFFMVTFFWALFFILGFEQPFIAIFRIRKGYLFSVEMGHLLYGIILFLRSVYRMAYMIHYIFSDSQRKADKELKDFSASVKNIKKEMENFKSNSDDM